MAAPIVVIELSLATLIIHIFQPCLSSDLVPLCKTPSLNKHFHDFVLQYDRPYLNNATEYEFRCDVFQANMLRAQVLTKLHSNIAGGAKYGVNKFADLTPEEFEAKYLSHYKLTREPVYHHHKLKQSGITKFSIQQEIQDLPKKVDWREKKAVTPVKDQKSCGACWAFSIVETMESMVSIVNSSVPSPLSVQQLIDCDSESKGCEGGDICLAADFAMKVGVVPESSYPLTDHTDTCKRIPPSTSKLHIKSYTCAGYISKEQEILQLLTKGPIAVAIGATTWHNYIGGIIQYHCAPVINHAVSIVGYDLTGDVPYYILRNSWGADFGDHGYLYVKYGDNLCGLASRVSSVDVKL